MQLDEILRGMQRRGRCKGSRLSSGQYVVLVPETSCRMQPIPGGSKVPPIAIQTQNLRNLKRPVETQGACRVPRQAVRNDGTTTKHRRNIFKTQNCNVENMQYYRQPASPASLREGRLASKLWAAPHQAELGREWITF